MAMPIDGIRVIDWTIWQQGPVAEDHYHSAGHHTLSVTLLARIQVCTENFHRCNCASSRLRYLFAPIINKLVYSLSEPGV